PCSPPRLSTSLRRAFFRTVRRRQPAFLIAGRPCAVRHRPDDSTAPAPGAEKTGVGSLAARLAHSLRTSLMTAPWKVALLLSAPFIFSPAAAEMVADPTIIVTGLRP